VRLKNKNQVKLYKHVIFSSVWSIMCLNQAVKLYQNALKQIHLHSKIVQVYCLYSWEEIEKSVFCKWNSSKINQKWVLDISRVAIRKRIWSKLKSIFNVPKHLQNCVGRNQSVFFKHNAFTQVQHKQEDVRNCARPDCSALRKFECFLCKY